MKKAYNLYLFLSLAFITILVISFFTDIDPKVILGYSVATLIFSIIDFFEVIKEGKEKLSLVKNNDMEATIDEYLSSVNVALEGAMVNIKDGNKEMINTRKRFYQKLIAQQPIINLKKKNVKKAIEPIGNINEMNKDLKFTTEVFDNLRKNLEAINPASALNNNSKFSMFFFMIALILIVSSPFIPRSVFIFLLGENFNSIGTYLVLISLSLIFFTSFFRSKYDYQIRELQVDQYHAMIQQFNSIKFMIEFKMKDLDGALESSSQEFSEVMDLLASSLEKAVEQGG